MSSIYKYSKGLGTVNLVQLSDEVFIAINKRVMKKFPSDTVDGFVRFVDDNSQGNLTFDFNVALAEPEESRLTSSVTAHTPDFTYDAKFPLNAEEKSTRMLATVENVDLRGVSATTIYIVPLVRKLVVTKAVLRPVMVSGVTQVPTVSIGTDPPLFANIFSSTQLIGFNSNIRMFQFDTSSASMRYGQGGDVVRLNTIVGANAGSYLVDVDLIGYLI